MGDGVLGLGAGAVEVLGPPIQWALGRVGLGCQWVTLGVPIMGMFLCPQCGRGEGPSPGGSMVLVEAASKDIQGNSATPGWDEQREAVRGWRPRLGEALGAWSRQG